MGIGKNGVIDSYSFSNQVPIHEMQTKILDDGSVWARIHWLDFTNSTEGFGNAAAVAECLNKENRYSRMGLVDEFKSADGKYEFMLTYPSLSSTLYNRWSQTSSPNENTVTGFTAITTAWSTYNGGIWRANNSATLYHCTPKSIGYWHGAIGQYSIYNNTGIPDANGTITKSTELWVRVDTVLKEKVSIYKNCITASDFIEL